MSARPLAAAAIAIAIAHASTALAERPVDGVAAVVDGVPITAHAVRVRAAPALELIQRSGDPWWKKAESSRAALRATLQTMIDDVLFEEVALEHGISLGSAVVDRYIDRVAASMKLGRAAYLDWAWSTSGVREAELRVEVRSYLVSWYVLQSAWERSRDATWPGQGPEYEAWRKTWLDERRRSACIERKLSPSP